jgi:sporulation protein YqfC
MRRPEKLPGMSDFSMRGRMELNGNREAVVEGCGGVLEYDETVVRIRTPGQVVRFTGRGLTIRCLTEDALVVTGYITGIEFLG